MFEGLNLIEIENNAILFIFSCFFTQWDISEIVDEFDSVFPSEKRVVV